MPSRELPAGQALPAIKSHMHMFSMCLPTWVFPLICLMCLTFSCFSPASASPCRSPVRDPKHRLPWQPQCTPGAAGPRVGAHGAVGGQVGQLTGGPDQGLALPGAALHRRRLQLLQRMRQHAGPQARPALSRGPALARTSENTQLNIYSHARPALSRDPGLVRVFRVCPSPTSGKGCLAIKGM